MASKSEGARYGPCMRSWPFIIPLALREKRRVVLQELQVVRWEPRFAGQGDLPGWETPGGFSKALSVCLDQLCHQLTLVKAEVELSRKATFETPMAGNQGSVLA